jgi:hypothetical protein
MRRLRRALTRHEREPDAHQLDGLAIGAADAGSGAWYLLYLAMSCVLAGAQAKIDGDGQQEATAAFSLSLRRLKRYWASYNHPGPCVWRTARGCAARFYVDDIPWKQPTPSLSRSPST